MLVLTRKEGEEIIIWHPHADKVLAVVRITSVGVDRVRVGVSAEEDFRIDRAELPGVPVNPFRRPEK